MNWIKNLWNGSKDLKKQIEEMKVALDECGSKLVEKQEHINTTNAYWLKLSNDYIEQRLYSARCLTATHFK